MATKVVFLGNARTNKTKTTVGLLRRFGNARHANLVEIPLFQRANGNNGTYVPTIGTEVHPLKINGKHYNIWDTAGQDKLAGLRDGYLIGAQIVIIFTGGQERQNPRNYANKSKDYYVQQVDRVCPDAILYEANNATVNQIAQMLQEY